MTRQAGSGDVIDRNGQQRWLSLYELHAMLDAVLAREQERLEEEVELRRNVEAFSRELALSPEDVAAAERAVQEAVQEVQEVQALRATNAAEMERPWQAAMERLRQAEIERPSWTARAKARWTRWTAPRRWGAVTFFPRDGG